MSRDLHLERTGNECQILGNDGVPLFTVKAPMILDPRGVADGDPVAYDAASHSFKPSSGGGGGGSSITGAGGTVDADNSGGPNVTLAVGKAFQVGGIPLGLWRVKKISITTVPDGTVQDTGFDLPQRCIIHDVLFVVDTAPTLGLGQENNFSVTTGGGFVDLNPPGAPYQADFVGIIQRRVGFAIVTGAGGWPVLGSQSLDDGVEGDRSVTYQGGPGDWTGSFAATIFLIYLDLSEVS